MRVQHQALWRCWYEHLAKKRNERREDSEPCYYAHVLAHLQPLECLSLYHALGCLPSDKEPADIPYSVVRSTAGRLPPVRGAACPGASAPLQPPRGVFAT